MTLGNFHAQFFKMTFLYLKTMKISNIQENYFWLFLLRKRAFGKIDLDQIHVFYTLFRCVFKFSGLQNFSKKLSPHPISYDLRIVYLVEIFPNRLYLP